MSPIVFLHRFGAAPAWAGRDDLRWPRIARAMGPPLSAGRPRRDRCG